jgi:hypothetical protein
MKASITLQIPRFIVDQYRDRAQAARHLIRARLVGMGQRISVKPPAEWTKKAWASVACTVYVEPHDAQQFRDQASALALGLSEYARSVINHV